MKTFEGNDRVEFWEKIGRPIRRGTLEDLKVSDARRLRDALGQGDRDLSRSYLEYLHPLYVHFMLSTYMEWALAWPAFVAERLSREGGKDASSARMTSMVYEAWRSGMTSLSAGNLNEAQRPGQF